jgi:hypothetical protein
MEQFGFVSVAAEVFLLLLAFLWLPCSLPLQAAPFSGERRLLSANVEVVREAGHEMQRPFAADNAKKEASAFHSVCFL